MDETTASNNTVSDERPSVSSPTIFDKVVVKPRPPTPENDSSVGGTSMFNQSNGTHASGNDTGNESKSVVKDNNMVSKSDSSTCLNFSTPTPNNTVTVSTTSSLTTTSTTPPNFLRVPTNVSASVAALSSSSVSPTLKLSAVGAGAGEDHVTVKSEPQDDIKDYVETTMNELLGWYGLPKMDKSDTPQLTLNTYPASSSLSTTAQVNPNKPESATTSARTTATTTTTSTAAAAISNSIGNTNNIKRGNRSNCKAEEKKKKSSVDNKLSNDTNNNSSSCGADDEDDEDDLDDDGDDEDDDDDLADDDDFCDDIDDDLRDSFSAGSDVSPGGLLSPGVISGGVPEHERGMAIVCSWCQKNGTKLFTLGTPTGVKSFCSEICFTQCRRASFKKNKVCDWCKHVRHTVNFVDFQDGDIQLQFCSEKCLNQYKMNIFCTEARQHLQHIQNMSGEDGKKRLGDGKSERREGEILITPELWMTGHSEDHVVVKEEVNDDNDERREGDGRNSNNNRSNGRLEDEEEPGEVREKEREKVRRSVALEMGVRAALSDDSSCSNDDKLSTKLPSPLLSRQRNDSLASNLLISRPDLMKNHLVAGQRRDKDRIRKLLLDGKGETSSSSTSFNKESRNPVTTSKDKSDKHSSLSPQKYAHFASTLRGLSGNSDPTNAPTMLPNWATSQLLAMMPHHVSPSLATANINSSLSSLGYGSSPLLYSSLFGPNPLSVVSQAETTATNLAKSRHESRRELLRDRDRSAEAERTERKRESGEKVAPPVPLSPSTSHSSSDTPGPSSTPGVNPPMIQTPGLAPGFVPNFPRHLAHPLLTNDISQSSHLPHIFTDPALASLLQLPFPYNVHHLPRGAAPPAAQATATTPPVSVSHPTPGHSAQPPPPRQAQHHPAQPPPTTAQPQTFPPVTVLVPYPVAVPIPIPVPIPLPITPEKLFSFFKEKAEQEKSASATPGTSRWSTADPSADRHRSKSSSEGRSRASSVSHTINASPLVSPRPSSKCSSTGCLPYGSASSLIDPAELPLVLPSGRDSADSIMTLRREIGRSQLKAASTSPCSSSSLKRTFTPTLNYTLDLSKKARMDAPPHFSEDEAIDLSKMSTRSESPRKLGNGLEKENPVVSARASLSDSDIGTSSRPENLKVPKIHIISERPEPPLCQPPASIPLPVTPELSTYSSRRSRILDAPSVPKKSRSPSPERRYIRTVPRDMVEAARRRGLRARVRTK